MNDDEMLEYFDEGMCREIAIDAADELGITLTEDELEQCVKGIQKGIRQACEMQQGKKTSIKNIDVSSSYALQRLVAREMTNFYRRFGIQPKFL
jgi:hypothetical protein